MSKRPVHKDDHSLSSSGGDNIDHTNLPHHKKYPLRKEIKVEEQAVGEQSLTSGEEVEEGEFPCTLDGFGYYFNADDELRQIGSTDRFQFVVRAGDDAYNQRRYEALGDVITDHIYELLESRCGLIRTHIPVNAKSDDPTAFIFHTPNAFTSSGKDKLLILIHGAGAVRAGQWARRLIINDSLKSGSQIPYIERAVELGYDVLVTNTNHNRVRMEDRVTGRHSYGRPKHCDSPEAHGLYVWEQFVRASSPAKHIAVVAHSYGGIVTTKLLARYLEDFRERVFAVAFTDSVHSKYDFTKDTMSWIKQYGMNWVTSKEPVDTPIGLTTASVNDVPRLSAGHVKHEMTSWTSFNSIFKYLDRQLRLATKSSSGNMKTSGSKTKSSPKK